MKMKLYILTLGFLLTILTNFNLQAKWDYVLIDVSGDISNENSKGESEIKLLKKILPELRVSASDSIIAFAEGRCALPYGKFCDLASSEFEDLLNAIGGATNIYETVASRVDSSDKRLLVITNGYDTSWGFHPETLAKILGERNIRVDAIMLDVVAEQPTDSLDIIEEFSVRLYPSLKHKGQKDFINFIHSTGGHLLSLSYGDDAVPQTREFLAKYKDEKINNKHRNSGFDAEIVNRILKSFPRQKLVILKVPIDTKLGYGDIEIGGLASQADDTESTGLLIGWDKDATVSSEYSGGYNIIFATTPMEYHKKMDLLLTLAADSNGNRLTDSIPLELLPLMHYPGSGDEMYVCGFEILDDEDFDDQEDDLDEGEEDLEE